MDTNEQKLVRLPRLVTERELVVVVVGVRLWGERRRRRMVTTKRLLCCCCDVEDENERAGAARSWTWRRAPVFLSSNDLLASRWTRQSGFVVAA